MPTPLIESSTRHSVYLERLKTGEVNRFAAFLGQMDKSLRDRLTNDDLTDFSRARLERLLVKVDADLKDIFEGHWQQLKGNLIDLAEYEAGFEARSINNAIDPDAGFEAVIPSAAQVTAAVFSAPLGVQGPDGGSLLEPFLKNFSGGERRRITGAIRQGFFEGKTTQQIIQLLRGTRAKGFQDGILGMTSRKAEAIVRTGVAHAAQTARMETMQENADILKGYRWISTLDGRTSPQCRSLDQTVFPLDKGPRPPIHIRCRSSMAPELADEFQALNEGRTRASKDGPVDGNESYYEWLKKQPEEFIVDTIGKERANLLLNGGLSADQFAKLNLGRNFKPLTLDEMRKREPLAFARAEAATAPKITPRPKPAAKPKPKPADPELSGPERLAAFREDAKEYTVSNGNRNGVEYAAVVDGEGRELFRKKGDARSVTMTRQEIEQIRAASGVRYYHSHPSSSTLSGADVYFATAHSLDQMVAFGFDGVSEYVATPLLEPHEWKTLKRWYGQAKTRAMTLARRYYSAGKIDSGEASYLVHHLIMLDLQRRGGIKYEAVALDKHTARAMEEIDPMDLQRFTGKK